ncbi:hypothetical protein FHS96_005897 [Sphingomonas zeicaulis]
MDHETALHLRQHADDLREAIRLARDEKAGNGSRDSGQ